MSTFPTIYPNKAHPVTGCIANPDAWAKVSSYVSREDWRTINAMCASSGGISFIIDKTIHDIAEHIRTNNLVPVADTDRFLDFLRQRPLTQPSQPLAQRPGDDPGRNAKARQRAAKRKDVAPSVGENAAG